MTRPDDTLGARYCKSEKVRFGRRAGAPTRVHGVTGKRTVN